MKIILVLGAADKSFVYEFSALSVTEIPTLLTFLLRCV